MKFCGAGMHVCAALHVRKIAERIHITRLICMTIATPGQLQLFAYSNKLIDETGKLHSLKLFGVRARASTGGGLLWDNI
jgi:hypothetical protein